MVEEGFKKEVLLDICVPCVRAMVHLFHSAHKRLNI